MNSERSGPIQEGVIRHGTLASLLAACFLAFSLAIWWVGRELVAETIAGPTSPSGIHVELTLTDAARWNPGSDYYTDVRLWRREPGAMFLWSDQDGQDSREGVEALRASMRWTSPDALEIETAEGKTIAISLSRNLWRLEEHQFQR